MSYAQAQAALAALPAGADRLAHAAETVYAWRETYVTYRTLRAFFADRADPDPKGRTDALSAAVAAADPLAHQMLLTSADGGGVDLARADAQTQIAQLRAAGLFSADEVAALYDTTLYGRPGPARTPRGPRYAAEWGLDAFDQATLDRLDDWVRWEALSLAVDGLLAAVDADRAGASALAGVEVTDALRDALPALVQSYRAKLLAGDDVADMSADAAAAWRRVKGGN